MTSDDDRLVGITDLKVPLKTARFALGMFQASAILTIIGALIALIPGAFIIYILVRLWITF